MSFSSSEKSLSKRHTGMEGQVSAVRYHTIHLLPVSTACLRTPHFLMYGARVSTAPLGKFASMWLQSIYLGETHTQRVGGSGERMVDLHNIN